MLRIKNLHAYYGRIKAIDNVSIHVQSGEIVSLIGANGAGKTTILNAISGLIRCARGEIVFQEKKVNGLAPEKVVAAGISQVPEGRQIFGPLTVLENLQLGAYLRFRKKEKEAIDEDLNWVFQFSRVLKSGPNRLLEPFLVESNRCSPSAEPLWQGPSFCCWTNLPWGSPRWL